MSEDPDAHALSPSWPNRLLLATIIKDWLVKQAAEGNYLRVPGSSVWACRRPDNIAQYARKLNVWCILSVRIQRLPSPLRPFSREAKLWSAWALTGTKLSDGNICRVRSRTLFMMLRFIDFDLDPAILYLIPAGSVM
ncbi:unnamed protein product [Fusarium graminearum]|uniref:Uncharacterized protein n=1 Tax=Gibberella zeae TaxID=5518 RepID=A0A4E9E542_GIBZA|nr:unnamed protein product [Fusarium graminearum]CAF3493905.1 unnamed protein product [Fusarium graminearum]CAG1976554.1 unnamed protein product [Fusarium graminearum]CAG2010242.1 unnamed protein product [Fusarium graminearum]